jgi:type II secretion system protein G
LDNDEGNFPGSAGVNRGVKRVGRYYGLFVTAQALLLFGILALRDSRRESGHSPELATLGDVRGGLKVALGMLEVDCGRLPTTEEGLKLLVSSSTNVQNWRGPYFDLPSVPEDPWGHEYVYRCPGIHDMNGYDLYSLGRDGVSKSRGNDPDDICNWDLQRPLAYHVSWSERAQALPLVIPFLLGIRIIGGIVSRKVRAVSAEHRFADLVWFLISILALVVCLTPRISG